MARVMQLSAVCRLRCRCAREDGISDDISDDLATVKSAMTRRRRYQRSLGDASAMARATDAGIRDDDFGDDREAMESPATRVITNRDGHIGDDSTLRGDADACGRLPAAMPGSAPANTCLTSALTSS